MKKYDLITPEGTRDLLFDESVAIRTLEQRITNIFISNSYSEVITPGLEFYDVFNLKNRYFAQESLYKLTDSKGRLMVIRPDSTMPIARLVATRLRDEALPLKLFYCQNIYRVNPKNNARDDEITQAGIEIIGGDEKKADLEALTLAIEVLSSCDAGDYRLELGSSAFFKALVSRLCIDEEMSEEIRLAIETKNYPELNSILECFDEGNPDIISLKALPKLFGGAEVFEKAKDYFKDDETLRILESFREIYDALCLLGLGNKISVDFGLVNKASYYTGILFRGYIEGCGRSVLSGGRYNTLIGDFGAELHATGFALDINSVARAFMKKSDKTLLKKPDILVFSDDDAFVDAVSYCRKKIGEGLVVDNSLFASIEQAVEYAKAKGIPEVHTVKKGGFSEIMKLSGENNG